MPELITHLKIFVSSPSDVEEERQILGTIVNELNKVWSKTLRMHIELLMWETDSYPDIGESPQEVINKQIGDDYDIFVGILWQRFGSPTKHAGSGTEEEFNIAYDRYRKKPECIKIMFYFKDAPIPPSAIDPEQITKIKNFQKELGEKGTLYWTYKDIKEFEQLFRMHISKHVQNWKEKVENKDKLIVSGEMKFTEKSEKIIEQEIEQDFGLLDLLESFFEKIQIFVEIMERMTQAVTEFGGRLTQRTEEILSIGQIKNPSDLKKARLYINRAVGDLDHFNTKMKAEVPLFATTYTGIMSIFSNTLIIQADFTQEEEDEMQAALESLNSMLENIKFSKDQVVTFRNVIVGTPRIASNYNRAIRNTTKILNELIEEMEKAETLTIETIKSFPV